MKSTKSFSPERLYIKYDQKQKYTENELKHLSRYRLASMFANGCILDVACGSGYGTNMLSKCGNVVGVEPSEEALKFARSFNFKPNITYINKFVQSFNPMKKFDTIVCLETFEHVDTGIGFDMLVDFMSWLKPGGQIILSTPMLRYKDDQPYVTNPYHVNEMPREQFINQLEHVWKGMKLNYFVQDVEMFRPLDEETTGFLVVVARHVGGEL